jgi:hypothetical protein
LFGSYSLKAGRLWQDGQEQQKIVGKWMREKEMEADRDRKYDWKDRSLSCVFMYFAKYGDSF